MMMYRMQNIVAILRIGVIALRAKATIPYDISDAKSAYPLPEELTTKIQTGLKEIKKGSVDYLRKNFYL